MADEPEVSRLRALVDEAHGHVATGSYDAAVAAFERALAGLQAALGVDHPEVAELAEDLEAARQMQEVHGFGRALGYRGFITPGPPDDDA